MPRNEDAEKVCFDHAALGLCHPAPLRRRTAGLRATLTCRHRCSPCPRRHSVSAPRRQQLWSASSAVTRSAAAFMASSAQAIRAFKMARAPSRPGGIRWSASAATARGWCRASAGVVIHVGRDRPLRLACAALIGLRFSASRRSVKAAGRWPVFFVSSI